VVKAGELRDVVAALPFQCGFVPEHSIVVVSLRGPARRIGLVARVDLPDPGEADAMAVRLADYVDADNGSGCLVVVYDESHFGGVDRPHEHLVRSVTTELDRRHITVLDALYVTPARYWSYTCTDLRCCPADGHLVAEAQSSPVAAAYVMAGLAPLASRSALVERLRPVRPLLVRAVSESTWRWLTAFAAAGSDELELRERGTAAMRLFAELLTGYAAGGGEVGVDDAGRLLASLQDVTIRDELLLRFCQSGLPVADRVSVRSGAGLILPADDEPGPETGEAVERLLVDLCVRLDGPLACAPLAVLGWHSWARGEGALARVAVERAVQEDPTYRLATLLLTALDHGVAPEWVVQMREDDAQAG